MDLNEARGCMLPCGCGGKVDIYEIEHGKKRLTYTPICLECGLTVNEEFSTPQDALTFWNRALGCGSARNIKGRYGGHSLSACTCGGECNVLILSYGAGEYETKKYNPYCTACGSTFNREFDSPEDASGAWNDVHKSAAAVKIAAQKFASEADARIQQMRIDSKLDMEKIDQELQRLRNANQEFRNRLSIRTSMAEAAEEGFLGDDDATTQGAKIATSAFEMISADYRELFMSGLDA